MCYLLAIQDILDETQEVPRSSLLLDRMRAAKQRLEKEHSRNTVASTAVSKCLPLLSSQSLPASPRAATGLGDCEGWQEELSSPQSTL